jgi:hypothetical protein
LPEYEHAVLRQNKGNNLPMDDLNFNKDELIVMEGTAILDFSLLQIMHEHYLTRATLTTVAKEINLAIKPPV